MSYTALDYTIPIFFAVEVETFTPAGAGSFTAQVGWAAVANMAFATATPALPTPGHLYASDTGYRTKSTDAPGMRIYKGRLDSAFNIDRSVPLDPSQASGSVAWGTINLLNNLGDYDGIANSSNSDARPVAIFAYNKIWDQKRQIYIDPPYANLVPVFTGISTPWFCDENALQIPIRDGTYYLVQPVQTSLYGGSGGLDGGADLAGKYIPITRGGTPSAPVLNVTPILVDPAHLIYQYTDGPGTVQALYEGGLSGGITFSADVADLTVGSTPAAQYRTCNAKGLFQLGSSPVYQITADVTGQFLSAGAVTTVIAIAAAMLQEQSELPSSMINLTQFAAADAAYPYVGGFFQGTDPLAGADAINSVLASIGAKLVPTRTGGLQCLVLRAPAGTPIASYDETQIVTLVAQSVGPPLDPPPYRYRVGYQQNWTVQTSGLNPSTSVTATRKSFLANQFRYAFAANAATLAAYQKPSDPDPLPGIITSQANAQSVANDLMALWGVRRRFYQIAFPVGLGIRHEIGDLINISFPTDDLQNGMNGIVIGEQFRGGDATTTLMVLI
jgi:hypothetical protein